jgi:hypothetical protein
MISIINTVIQINAIKPMFEMTNRLETLPEYDDLQMIRACFRGTSRCRASASVMKRRASDLKNVSLEIRPGESWPSWDRQGAENPHCSECF